MKLSYDEITVTKLQCKCSMLEKYEMVSYFSSMEHLHCNNGSHKPVTHNRIQKILRYRANTEMHALFFHVSLA